MKRFLKYVLIALVCMCVFFYELLFYGVEMGYNQLSIVWNAKPIEVYLNHTSTPDSMIHKLKLIQKARRFAIDSLGLVNSTNYTSVYDQKGKTLLWNVSGCKPFSFEAKKWSFPIVGDMPYKGFFDYEKAKEEARLLKEEGFDVRIRPVGGWSTLGWFNDPILSNMLSRSDGDLVEFIIHELTHSTLFVKGEIEFNENLASFIGVEGTKRFFQSSIDQDSTQLNIYLNEEYDTKLFYAHVLNGVDKLNTLYTSFNLEPDSVKTRMKETLINDICMSIDTVSFKKPENWYWFKTYKPNNAYFMSIKRYNAKQNQFETEFRSKFNSNFRAYLTHLFRLYKIDE